MRLAVAPTPVRTVRLRGHAAKERYRRIGDQTVREGHAAQRRPGPQGLAGASEEAVTTGLQRSRSAMGILTDLLRAEGAHREAVSIRYRITTARLPVVNELSAFAFDVTPC